MSSLPGEQVSLGAETAARDGRTMRAAGHTHNSIVMRAALRAGPAYRRHKRDKSNLVGRYCCLLFVIRARGLPGRAALSRRLLISFPCPCARRVLSARCSFASPLLPLSAPLPVAGRN